MGFLATDVSAARFQGSLKLKGSHDTHCCEGFPHRTLSVTFCFRRLSETPSLPRTPRPHGAWTAPPRHTWNRRRRASATPGSDFSFPEPRAPRRPPDGLACEGSGSESRPSRGPRCRAHRGGRDTSEPNRPEPSSGKLMQQEAWGLAGGPRVWIRFHTALIRPRTPWKEERVGPGPQTDQKDNIHSF